LTRKNYSDRFYTEVRSLAGEELKIRLEQGKEINMAISWGQSRVLKSSEENPGNQVLPLLLILIYEALNYD